MARRVVALVPARGGSQSVPRKNLADVGGLSLLERAINSCQDSRLVTEVFVTSDDDEILELASSAGVQTVIRPSEISRDTTRANEVVEHFLGLNSDGRWNDDDVLAYLQPTSPFRKQHHVDGALGMMLSGAGDGVVSVKIMSEHPAKSLQIDSDGRLGASSCYSGSSTNRQELNTHYYPNGAIFAFTIGNFRQTGDFPTLGSQAFVMDQIESIDIDSVEDLQIARAVAIHSGL